MGEMMNRKKHKGKIFDLMTQYDMYRQILQSKYGAELTQEHKDSLADYIDKIKYAVESYKNNFGEYPSIPGFDYNFIDNSDTQETHIEVAKKWAYREYRKKQNNGGQKKTIARESVELHFPGLINGEKKRKLIDNIRKDLSRRISS